MTASQCKEARRLLGWSQQQLSSRTMVPREAIGDKMKPDFHRLSLVDGNPQRLHAPVPRLPQSQQAAGRAGGMDRQ